MWCLEGEQGSIVRRVLYVRREFRQGGVRRLTHGRAPEAVHSLIPQSGSTGTWT